MLFSGASSSKVGGLSAGDTLLSHSQQLRAEFTFLLRALDQCGEATSNSSSSSRGDDGADQQRRSSPQSGSIVLFSYALEVALTLVRFDVLLNQEERKLLVHAFDRLLQAELSSLHRVEQRLHYCAETAASLRLLKQRSLVLDSIDWFHVIAKCCGSSSAVPQSSSIDSPGASAPAVGPEDTSATTTPLCAPAPIVGEPLSANAARIYSNILVNGVIPPSALPLSSPPPSKQGTVVIETPLALELSDAPPTAASENVVVVTTDDFIVLAGSANSTVVVPPFATTPNSPSVLATHVVAPQSLPNVRFSSTPVFQLTPAVTKWAIDAFTQEQCRGSNIENYTLTQMVPVTFPTHRQHDVSFSSTSYLDSVGIVRQLRATLVPTSGPFALHHSHNATSGAAANAATAGADRRTSIRDDDECFSLASTVNDVLPANVSQTPPAQPSTTTVEAEHLEIVRRNVSSTVTNKSLGLSRVSSQHSVDTIGFAAAARSGSSNGLSTASGARQSAAGPPMATTAVPKPTQAASRIDVTSCSPVSAEGPGARQRVGNAAPKKEVLTLQEEFVYRIVQAALLQHDNRWSHLRNTTSGSCSVEDGGGPDVRGGSDVFVAPTLRPSTSLANYSFSSGRVTQPLWMLASDEVVAQKTVSTPICQEIDNILESIEASVHTLLSMKRQLRSEITLLCFRVVSTVVDLLLPAAECRGKSLTMFYRKWVCDVYRVLCQEHLLKGFMSLVHRAKVGGSSGAAAATTSVPSSSDNKPEMKSFGSSSNMAGRTSPPQTNSPQLSRMRNSNSATAMISAALGGSLNASLSVAAGLFRRSSATPAPTPTMPATTSEFGVQLTSATLRTSNRSFLRDEVDRGGTIPNSSFDALDDSTSVFPPNVSIGGESAGNGIPSLLPLTDIDAHGNGRGPLGEEALDDATAVGSLFRTFRRHNTATNGEVGVKSPMSTTTAGGNSSDLNYTTSSGAAGGNAQQQGSGSDSSSSAAAHQPSAVAVTLFRSLHGDLCVPPTGCLGTRLMFTLLNGTDVTSFDFKDTDLGNTQSGAASASPQHRHAPLSPQLHQRSNSSCGIDVLMMPRSRTNSAAPTVSPPITNLNASNNSLTPRALFPNSATDAAISGAVSSTTSIIAMPHHHTFRYPSVRSVDDVRALYAALFQDAEVVLSPHDPLRAAITLNYAEFLALVAGKRGDAADTIAGYLDEVDAEPIQPFATRQVDLIGSPALPSSVASTALHPLTPTPSAFSVTNVRRTTAGTNHGLGATAAAAGVPSTITSMPPQSSTATIMGKPTSAVAAMNNNTPMTPICDLIPSWQNKEERTQFVELVGLLKSALATLGGAR
ncbi:Hypothetical protein, putative [Bodo saltans]|uniref:Uncharacterized protein n=1 Tax=Bodo saltans TaxID=75058 RepID=A0A0S4J8I5_BODSA|nr:Hypothetical protein, putative [Bodo saltans]|eukprot:CUG82354.1 Hypothetical protein, putative [Bodo saltans]